MLNDYTSKTYDKKYKIRFGVREHFIERVIERFNGNFDRAFIEIVKAIEANICIIIYYMHLDTILPERGKIEFGDYEIRGYVCDDRFILSTFLD